jgi:hypothetical protein
MAYPGIKKKTGKSFDFYEIIEVDWEQFGAPDGYTITDGYGPDIIIPFSTQVVSFVNFAPLSTNAVEYSFNGIDVHGDITPQTPSAGLIFDNRKISLIWFRIKAGSTGPVSIRVEAW